MKYESAYFCGYAKLPSALPTQMSNGSLTLGLLIELETAIVLDTSTTLPSRLANEMIHGYFTGKSIIDDYEQILDEITCRHQGIAAKPLMKALGDIRRTYIEYMESNRNVQEAGK